MQVRSLGFRTDLMLRRLAGATVSDRGDHIVVRTPQNPTFYWGNFVLLAAPPAAGEAERWLETFASEFPAAGHVALGVDGTDGDLGTGAETLRAVGLRAEVAVVLTAPALDPPFRVDPAAVLRPLESDDDWGQAVELRMALDSDEGDQHRRFVERRLAELRSLTDAGHGVYVGAFVDGVARATLGLCTDGGGLGRFQNVETHPDFRRRGLAAGLLSLAAALGQDRLGVTTLVIVADPDYVAVDLYRRLGFVDTERQVQWLRGPADQKQAVSVRG